MKRKSAPKTPEKTAPASAKPAAAPAKPAAAPVAPAPAPKAAAPAPAPVKPAALAPAKPAPAPIAPAPAPKAVAPAPAPAKPAASAPAKPAPAPVAPAPAPKAVAPAPAPAKPAAPAPAKPAPAPVAPTPAPKAVAPAPAPAKPAAPAPAKPAPAPVAPTPAPKAVAPAPAPAKPAVPAPAAAPAVPAAAKRTTAKKADSPAEAAPKASRKRAVKAKSAIPPILLEGDETPAPAVSGPGQRYSLGPSATPATLTGEEAGELPEAYGTKRLLLTARDPQWLYAHWDLTRDQQRDYNQLSADGHLVLRVYVDQVGGEPAADVHVHPESRHWFVHVGQGGTKYVAILGYRSFGGQWITISTSSATLTPPDSLSDDTSLAFATLPVALPLPKLVALVKELAMEHVPLVQAIQELRAAGHVHLPGPAVFDTHAWTPEQERALMEVVNMDTVRRVWIGSLEITELIRRKLVGDLSSQAAAGLAGVTSPASAFGGPSSLSSPFGGGEQKAKGFWFNVNAELIIYGATEPDATVTIGGRPIQLRRDGSFSYRFALPDGQYPLPAVATSADGTDTRWAELHFARSTNYGGGEVGAHPQDPSLQPPTPDSV